MTTRETVDRYFAALRAKDGWQEFLADGMAFTSFTSPAREVSGREAFAAGTKNFYGMIRSYEVRDVLVDGSALPRVT